ncbi:MAG: hypothetical protein NDJ92_14250 [Thermoanaerobaculia bacterium]|nr:hypothetical protein [Thermoanaerobaculia bacterium]
MINKIEVTKDRMDAMVDKTGEAVGGLADRAELGVETAAAKVVEQTRGARDYLREKVDSATQKVHRRLDQSATAIDRGYTRASSELSRAAGAATGFASENPRTALLIAATTGFVLGFMVHRHRSLR